jgi:PAS domain S-box-containing protein
MSVSQPPVPQALLQGVLSATQNGVLVYHAVRDNAGTIVDLRVAMVNAVAEQDFGKPATEILGQSYSRLFPNVAEADLFDHYRQSLETGVPTRFGFQYTLSGQAAPSWFDISVAPMQDSIIVSYDNVTQTRTARILQQAFDSALSGCTVYEALYDAAGQINDFRFVAINEAGLQMSGYTREQLIGKTIWEIYPATGINGLFDQYVQVCRTGTPLSGENYYPEYDIWRAYTIVQITGGVMINYTDITPQKKQEEIVDRQTRTLQGILESVSVSIVVLKRVQNSPTADDQSVNFTVVHTNSAFRAAFAPGTTEVTGQRLTDLLPRAQESGLLSRCIMAADMRLPHQFEMPDSINGSTRWYQVSMTPQDDQLVLSLTDVTESRQLQINHHRQAELLRSISNNTPAGLVLWQAVRDDTPRRAVVDFRYRMSNGINNYLTGRTEAQLLGNDLLALFPRFRGTELETSLRDALETGRTQHMLFTYYTEPQDRWIDAQFSRIDDTVLMTFVDVTEQHKIQLAQKELADTFNAVLNSNRHGMSVMRAVRDETGQLADLIIEHISEQVARDTGLSRQQYTGSTILTLFPGFRQSRIWQAYTQALETGEAQQFEEYYRYDGFDNYANHQVARIDENRLVATYQIINELKAAQRKAEEQARLLEAVINVQPGGVVLYDPVREPTADGQPGPIVDFTYVLVNETNSRVTGRAATELIGQRFKILFPSEDANLVFERMVAVAEQGDPQAWLLPYFNDGIQGWFQSSLIRHEGQVLFTFLDVSELKHQQQALEVANLNLRRSNENLQQFAYVASHDLQEPLRKIQAFGDMLATKYKDVLDEPGQDMIRRMQASAKRMSMLIRDLLAYSRLSTHRVPYKQIALTDVVGRVLTDLELRIAETAAVIEVDDLPEVSGEPRQLEQLMLNLLGNALKFQRPGVAPHIRISSRRLPATAVPVGILPAEAGSRHYQEISVADNGIGFDEQYLDRIFQVFQRLHGVTSFVGSGVGLAICRKVVENHDGGITARSMLGVGSTFLVYLPVIQ